MSIHEFKTGKTFHVWQSLTPTSRVYLGTFNAKSPTEAGCQAANRHSTGGLVLVKLSKHGATVARV